MNPTPATPSILFVCTGNVCRSPYMEYRLRALIEGTAPAIQIYSAGTRAAENSPMSPPMARRLDEQSIDPSRFGATLLRRDHVDAATVVITATRAHRRDVVHLQPDAAERTFTLAQLARLLRAAPPHQPPAASVAELIEIALGARGAAPLGRPEDDDLEDPWRRSRRVYGRVADRIDDLLIPLAQRLAAGA